MQSYDRFVILSHFNKILNADVPEYGEFVDGGFSNSPDGAAIGYTVFDLSDTLNVSKMFPGDSLGGINFVEGHFFHFSPALMYISFSYVAYLEKGKMIVFKKINCPGRGDSFESVVNFARKKLKDLPSEKVALKNITNYREFGVYFIEDAHSEKLNCY